MISSLASANQFFDTAPRAREPVTFFIDPFGERQIAHLVLAAMGVVTTGV